MTAADRNRHQDESAFVLHSYPFRETSLILDVFSRSHGRLAMVAALTWAVFDPVTEPLIGLPRRGLGCRIMGNAETSSDGPGRGVCKRIEQRPPGSGEAA